MRKIFLFIILFVNLASCNMKESKLDQALNSAGANRIELEKVLKYYVGDSLKHKAAQFLIENMPYYYYYSGEELEHNKQFFRLLAETDLQPAEIADSLNRISLLCNFGEIKQKQDILDIDSAYLVHNIEWAFKVWQGQPWGKNVSFDDFCEYILPYRLGDENLTYWREDIYNRYSHLLDDVRLFPQAEDPFFVAQVLLDSLRRTPARFSSYHFYDYSVGPQIADWRSGSCREQVDAVIYIFRALGIPCGCDQMLMRGDGNVGHFLNFILDKERKTHHFAIASSEGKLYPANTYWDPKGKIYRTTFSINHAILDSMNKQPEDIHPTFRLPFIVDVTSEYTKYPQVLNISSEQLYYDIPEKEVVYLCLSSWREWVPVAFACYNNKQLRYKPLEGNVVFRLATYKQEKLNFISDPFLLDKYSGEVRFFDPQEESEKIILLHKFRLSRAYPQRMIGGVFEGSNRADFALKDTLSVIKNKPARLWNVIHLDNDKKYRYVRYMGPKGSYCNISEAAFYDCKESDTSLEGKTIGTPNNETKRKTHDYSNVFDGDPNTSFDYYLPDGGWAGLDLGAAKNIRKIVYTARNFDNFIRVGHNYELFYDQRGAWHSAGRINAVSDSLVYNVPKGALLYLRNHTTGKEERIFEYRNGEQIFW